MVNKDVTQTKTKLCCSFCSKNSEQVKLLIAGPPIENSSLYICNECVEICNKIISREIPRLTKEEANSLTGSN